MPSANLSIFLRHKIEKFQRDSEHSCKPQQPPEPGSVGSDLGLLRHLPPLSPHALPGCRSVAGECARGPYPGCLARAHSQGALLRCSHMSGQNQTPILMRRS